VIGMTEKIGQFFFKSRSFTPVPFLFVILIFAAPAWWSVALGAFLMLLGEAIRLWGVGYAGFITRTRNVGALPLLVTSGPFAIIRNPLYAGNFFISLGVCVAFNALMPWVLVLFVCLYAIQYYFIVRLEEAALVSRFGDEYRRYAMSVPRFFHRFKTYDRPSRVFFNAGVAFANERKTFVSILVILTVTLLFTLFRNPVLPWIRSLLSA
jgi:protein-S-isoprenylcysteine O-methyltransferase Ste14